MILFHNDYNETCHPAVLSKLAAAASSQQPGYGMDPCCKRAASLIREKCGRKDLDVHFLVGGTQTNLTVIAAALRPYQAVLSADSGHINIHETGAIEATGHKVIQLPQKDGKITAQQIEQAVLSQRLSADAEHIAQPKLVYISNPTECGTTYSLSELESISAVCRKYRQFLFVDGARLGYALASDGYDVTWEDMARLTDVFYIGGTKVGAMFGEAVVIANPLLAEDFRYLIKQRGGMLAKGWLLGLQFEALLEDNLYFSISAHADRLADQIRHVLHSLGYPLLWESKTNQVFATLPDHILEKLSKSFTYAVWERADDSHTTVRFCTSWATKPENVDALCCCLKQLTDLNPERGEYIAGDQ